MINLGATKRRTPLGHLPRAHFGISAAEAGLVLLHEEVDQPASQAIPTRGEGDYLIRVATGRPHTAFGFRVHGVGAPHHLLDTGLISAPQPRFRRRPGSAQDIPLRMLLPKGPYVAAEATIPRFRDYLTITAHDENELPLNDLLVITEDSAITFGWLSSQAFWVWQQMVADSEPKATSYRAYVTFPAPELSPKHRRTLEIAVDTVLRARGYALDNDMRSVYEDMPDALRNAHDELDAVANELLDLPRDASTDQIVERLEQKLSQLNSA